MSHLTRNAYCNRGCCCLQSGNQSSATTLRFRRVLPVIATTFRIKEKLAPKEDQLLHCCILRRGSSFISACDYAPAPATTNRVIGHLGTYSGIVVSHLGCHARGEICGILGESQLPWGTPRACEGMHCGIVLVTRPGCHTSTPVASQASHNYHSRCSKTDITLFRMHARNASRRRRALRSGDTGKGTSLPEIEKPFYAKLCENLPDDALSNTCFPLFVFSVLFLFCHKFFFLGHQTDGQTRDIFWAPKRGSSARQTRKA